MCNPVENIRRAGNYEIEAFGEKRVARTLALQKTIKRSSLATVFLRQDKRGSLPEFRIYAEANASFSERELASMADSGSGG